MRGVVAAAAVLPLLAALALPLSAAASAPVAQSMEWTSLSRAQWPARKGHCALVHRGFAFVIAGGSKDTLLNDVWSAAEDGALRGPRTATAGPLTPGPDLSVGTQRWTKQSSAAFRTSRQSGACVRFQHRMYFLGGQQEESPKYLNEVYVSDDGSATPSPGPLPAPP